MLLQPFSVQYFNSLSPQSERSDFSSPVFGWRSKHWPPPTVNLNLYVSARRSVILQAQTYFSSRLMHPLQNLLSRPSVFICVVRLNEPSRVSLFPQPRAFVSVGLVLEGSVTCCCFVLARWGAMSHKPKLISLLFMAKDLEAGGYRKS